MEYRDEGDATSRDSADKFRKQHERAARRLADLPPGAFTVTRPLVASRVATRGGA